MSPKFALNKHWPASRTNCCLGLIFLRHSTFFYSHKGKQELQDVVEGVAALPRLQLVMLTFMDFHQPFALFQLTNKLKLYA